MRDQLRALERLAASWERRGGLPRAEFEAAAGDLARDLPFIQAIEWADPEFRVRWIVPLEGNEAAQDLDLAFEARRRAALELARDGHTAAASRPIQLVQGGLGFVVYVPLEVEGRFEGFLVGVCRVDDLLSGLLENIAPGFGVRVHDEGEPLHTREIPGMAWSHARVVQMRASLRPWSIEVAPGPEVVATYQTFMPLVVIVAGSVFALGFGFTAQQARSRRIRNRQLAAEVERRHDAEQELSLVVGALPDHVWSGEITPEGFQIHYFSPVIARITGHPLDQFKGSLEAWYEIVHEADVEELRRLQSEVLLGQRDGFVHEYRISAADGALRWLRERVRATRTERGTRLDGVTSDITETKRAEQDRLELETAVQQGQKLESLGVLAGGIAHDFNNLMVGVLGNARLAQEDLPEEATARGPLRRIERAAQRAADLCLQMLAYAGQVSIEKEPVDLRETVEEVRQLLAASTPKKVELQYDFGEALPLIMADATQIRQVLVNLVTNAAEAIGDRAGTIRMTATRCTRGREDLAHLELGKDLEPGDYVALTVADDGCGMDEETRRRFMEPFFSTKFSGRGLGLAAVQGTVRRHRGAIGVDTAVGRGTSITLFLPALPAATPRPSAQPPPASHPRGTGTVLLIDDDEDARELGAIALERAGYRPLTASDGIEGVEALRAHRSEVACVLLDLTMPRLDGADALRALRAVREDLPVILCSGYPEAAALERFDGLDVTGFLAKPYLPEELIAKIDAALADA